MKTGSIGCTAMLARSLAVAGTFDSSSPPPPPAYQTVRYDEDYRYLRDPARRADRLDRWKFIPFDSEGDAWLTLGGEARERYEYFENSNWGLGPQDRDGYFLQRYLLFADLHYHDHLRAFGQLQSALEDGRVGGPRPTDEDIADVHQAFVDFQLDLSDDDHFLLRAGRQEIHFGSQRLVSVRESPNTRLSFDGIRWKLETAPIRYDAFLSKPVRIARDGFDNEPNPDTTFWGFYITAPMPRVDGGQVEVYYLGIENREASYSKALGRELRHSVGTRLSGQHADWDYNVECVYQFGSFGDGEIAAWTVASETGYRFSKVALRPRLYFKADIASGDEDPESRHLGTFNALFPKGAYFSETGLVGPANLIDVHPGIELRLTPQLLVTADWDFFWRENRNDGLYNNALRIVRDGDSSSSREIGSQVQTSIQWNLNRHLSVNIVYAHFFAGRFLRDGPEGHDVNYLSTWVTFRF